MSKHRNYVTNEKTINQDALIERSPHRDKLADCLLTQNGTNTVVCSILCLSLIVFYLIYARDESLEIVTNRLTRCIFYSHYHPSLVSRKSSR